MSAPLATTRRRALLLLALAALSIWALPWRVPALFVAGERGRAFSRLRDFLAAFGAPDLSREALERAAHLAGQTLAIAVLGTLLGVAIGWLLGQAASRALWLDARASTHRRVTRAAVEVARLALDVLRGVPDFAWALLILTGPGPGPVTGVLALGLSTGGILGKIYSELWDGLPPRRLDALRSTGAGRLAALFFGLQPASARAMLSYTLMRLECSVRNATVIGVVGGGGLGAQLFEELGYGHQAMVVTLLGTLLLLTAGTDLFSNFLRRQLQDDPNHPRRARRLDLAGARRRRRLALGSVGVAVLASAALLAPAWARARGELGRIEWSWIGEQLVSLASLDLAPSTLGEVLLETRVPLALGLLATLLSFALAALLSWPGSLAFQLEPGRFTGERAGALRRLGRGLAFTLARATTLVLRSVPEVAWLLILAAFFTLGTLPGLLAMALHSAGVLGRVFVETVDNQPYRGHEPAAVGGRLAAFLYGALPRARAHWSTFAVFQFEANVRMGVVFGILGLGGLGDRFHSSLSHWNLPRAGTFLVAMVLLTVVVDRLSRRHHGARARLAA